jgi:hypothetical protein
VIDSKKFDGDQPKPLDGMQESQAKLVLELGETYTTTIQAYKDQQVEFGPYQYPDGAIYRGEYLKKLRHGRGLLITQDQTVFDGFWLQDNFSHGRVVRKSGEIYVGGIRDGKKEGRGELTCQDSEDYSKGTWFRDMLHGPNCTKIDQNTKYIGDLKHGKRHGKGQLTTRENFFEGDWIEDHLVNGTLKELKDGSYFKGSFKNSKPDGQCEFHDPSNNTSYIGHWSNGERNGKGKEKFTDGSIYEGDFKDDKMEGEGVLLNSKGQYVGQMKNDKREGKGTFQFKDGSKYEGSFVNDKFNGVGKLTEASGIQYEGEFINNVQQGRFKVTNPAQNNAVSFAFFVDGIRESLNSSLKQLTQSSNIPGKVQLKKRL